MNMTSMAYSPAIIGPLFANHFAKGSEMSWIATCIFTSCVCFGSPSLFSP
jgi:hypothetical protein